MKGKTPADSFSTVTGWDLCFVARTLKCFTSNASKVFCSDQPRPKNIEQVNKLFLFNLARPESLRQTFFDKDHLWRVFKEFVFMSE